MIRSLKNSQGISDKYLVNLPSRTSIQIAYRGFTRALFAVLASFTFAYSTNAVAASNSGITYHGRILKADGTALEGKTVQFKLQVRSPGSESCLLYEEIQTLNMSGSAGVFSLTLNDGTGTRDDSSGVLFDNIFSNRTALTFPAASCVSGAQYTPNPADGRSFVVSFKDEDMQAYEPLPAQPINFAPMALQSKAIAGYTPANLLKFDDTAALANTGVLNSTQLTNLMTLVNGGYVSSSTAGAGLPVFTAAPTAPATGNIWYNTTSGTLQYYNGSATQSLGTSGGGSGTVTSIGTGTGLTGGPITVAGTISLATFGTAGTYYKVVTDSTGRVSSGSTTLAETDLPNIVTAGKVSGAAITSGTIAGTTAVNTSGAITTTGTISGANVTATTLSGNSVRLFNSANTFKITFTAPALTADYNLIFPMTAGTSGYVLTTDGAGNLTWSSPGGAPSGTAGGDLSGTYPNPTVAKLSGTALTISSLTSGNYLRYNGTAWVNSAIQAADLPSLSSSQTGILPIANGGTGTSNGSITGSGTLTFAAGGSNQNVALTPSGTGYTLLGGKVGIGTTSPAAQLNLTSDLLAGTRVSVGAASYADLNLMSNGTVYQNGGDPFTRIQSTGSGNPRLELQANGPSAAATDAGHETGRIDYGGYNGSAWVNQAASVKGVVESTWTTSSNPIALTFATTAGTMISERMRISSSGNVGIGTVSPSATLQIDRSAVAGASAALLVKGNSDGSTYSSVSLQTGSTSDNWVMGHMGNAHNLLFFNYNGSYTNALQLQENGGITTGSYANSTQAAANALAVGGNVGIGTASPAVSLDLGARTDALALPKGATEPSSPATGWIRYNTSSNGVEFYNGTAWTNLSTSTTSSYTGVSNISNSSGNITLAPQSSSGAVVVNSGTAATSSGSGALQITGGEGVSGAIYAGSTINAGTSVTAATSMFTPQIYGSTAASGNINIDGTSNATSGYVLLAAAGGAVGIGTTSPADILSVVSTNTTSATTVNGMSASNTITGAPTVTTQNGGSFTVNNGSGNVATENGVLATANVNSLTVHANGGNFNVNNVINSVNSLTGVVATVSAGGAGSLPSAVGGNFTVKNTAGTTTSAMGVESTVANSNAQTITNAYGIYSTVTNTGVGVINNGYGVYVAPVAGTAKYGVYENSGGSNYFAGNVGIGTTSPGALLDVQAVNANPQIRITNSSSTGADYPGLFIYDYTGGNGGSAGANFVASRGTLASPAAIAAGDSIGTLSGWGQYDSTAGHIGQGAYLIFSADGAYATNSYPTAVVISTVPSGSATPLERFRISSGGKIGVGTTSPLVSLDLSSKIDAIALPSGSTSQEPSNAIAGMIRYNSTTSGVEFYNGSAWGSLGGGSSSTLTGVTSISDSTGNITLAPQSTSGAVVVNSGTASTSSTTGALQVTGGEGVSGAINAGTTISAGSTLTAGTNIISTAAGEQLIGVNGQIMAVQPTAASRVAYFALAPTGGASEFQLGGDSNYGSSSNYGFINETGANLSLGPNGSGGTLSFLTNARATTAMTMNSSGYVGIGSTSPAYVLDVSSAFNNTTTTANGANFTSTSNNNQNFTNLNGVNVSLNNSFTSSATNVNGVNATVASGSLGTNVTGGNFTATSTTSYPSSTTGVIGLANQQSGGTVASLTGGNFSATLQNGNGSSTVTSAYGVKASVSTQASQTATNAYGLYSSVANSGTNTNAYGLYVGTVAGSTKYGIYENSGGGNYFGGTIGVGTAPTGASISANGDITSSRMYPSGGSVTYPGYAFNAAGSGNQMGLFYIAQNVFGVSTNGTERMRFDASGNVGIGTTSPGSLLDVSGQLSNEGNAYIGGSQGNFIELSTNGATNGHIALKNGGTSTLYIPTGTATGAGNVGIGTTSPGYLLDVNGNARIGSNAYTTASNVALGIVYAGAGTQYAMEMRPTTSGATTVISMLNSAGSNQGSITINGTGTTNYNTTSDHRLKENVVPMTEALSRLEQLEPKRFNYIADPAKRTIDGFIAHEVQAVIPEAVTGAKDAVDANGKPIYQQVDLSKIIPLVAASTRELDARTKYVLSDTAGNVALGNPDSTVSVNGHLSSVGNSSAVVSCGSSAVINGNDTRGLITIGDGSPVSCTVNFAKAYESAPFCVVTPAGGFPGAVQWFITTANSSFTLNFSATPSLHQQFQYHCMQ